MIKGIEELDTVRIKALNVIGTVVDIDSYGRYTVEFVDDELPIGDHDKHILYYCRIDDIEFYHKGPVLAAESSRLGRMNLKLAICAFKLNKKKDVAKYAKKALTYIEPDVYPHQMYDDLRKVSHYILEIGRMDVADSIAELMKVYAAEKTGVTEQLIACRTLAEYYA